MEAADAFRVLALGALFGFPGALLVNVLIIAEKQRWVFLVRLVAVALHVALNLVLIPIFGYMGSCIAAVITGSLSFTTHFILARKAV